jgi:hypothetical protein
MVADVTGSNATLSSINRPEPRAIQAPTPARQEPSNLELRVPTPDVQVDTRLDRRSSAERSLIQESSNLAIAQQSRGEVLDQLRSERDQLATGRSTEVTPYQQLVTPETVEVLQTIRERALSEPFGQGSNDLGPLVDDSFFLRDRGEVLGALDGAISALERFADLDATQQTDFEEAFNAIQDARLSPDNSAIESADEAQTIASAVQQQLTTQSLTDANGLTSIEATPVLDALQSDQAPAI